MTDQSRSPNGSDKTADPGKPAEAIDPDDTGEILLSEMKRSLSDGAMAAVTDEEVAEYQAKQTIELSKDPDERDTVPPWDTDRLRKEQIAAWNNMAEQMVNVVRTIKRNEGKLGDTIKRMMQLVVLVGAFVFGGSGIDWYLGDTVVDRTAEQLDVMRKQNEDFARKQDAMLGAVIELAQAQALSIEAAQDFDPDKETAAKIAALDALKAALQAKKITTDSDAEKAAVDERIEQVSEKREAVEEAEQVVDEAGDDYIPEYDDKP